MIEKDIFLNSFEDNKVFFDEPMDKHTSFKAGGKAAVFFEPSSFEDIKKIIKIANGINIPFCIIGNGSNLLVSDKGFNGLIIKIGKKMSSAELLPDNKTIKAGSGILLSSIANFALKNNLSGLEFASGIPGSLGGGIFMNAGAYGGEIKDVIKSASLINYNSGEIIKFTKADFDFSYRHSSIQNREFVVFEAELELANSSYDLIKEKMDDFNSRRREKQPLEFPSAGSAFKRPEGHFAGKLIMDAGLKGKQIGGAKVSEKHCGFIINSGGATASDIINLIEFIKVDIYKKFNVTLEPELRIIGE